MLTVLNKRWLSMGWHAMDPADSEPMALTFIERLDQDHIPFEHYHALYLKAADLRSTRFAQGLKADDFSADMMAACWPALRAELRDREIARGRTLTASAQSQCRRCFGTGMEEIYKDGKYVGVKKGCDHTMLDETEASMSGLDDAISEAKLRAAPAIEPAAMICNRLRIQITKDFSAAEDEDVRAWLWRAARTMTHAERYCRTNPWEGK